MQNLSDIRKKAQAQPLQTIAVAAAHDIHVLEAVLNAEMQGIVNSYLVGDKNKISGLIQQLGYSVDAKKIIHTQSDEESAHAAVGIISKGKAGALMKGLLNTSTLLKAVLKKDYGLLTGHKLSHVAFIESPYYHKLLCITDAAMNIAPALDDKAEIIYNAVQACRQLGIKTPKVAVLCAIESVNPKMQATTEAAILTMMNKRGQIKNCIVDGPLALDNAISPKAAALKQLSSEVAGNADVLLVPEINTGNILYKSLNFLGNSHSAAVILGARVPIVLTSRADNMQSKLNSIALASVITPK